MPVLIPESLLMGLIVAIMLLGFCLLMFFLLIKKNAPEAFIFMKARRKKLPMVLVHYPEGNVIPSIPKVDRRAMSSSPEYEVEGAGIKFRNPDGRKSERWFGDIIIHNYFRNIPEEVAMSDVIAYSQLKDYFKENDVSVENIEDIAFYVLSEVEKSGDIQRALRNAKIDNEETAGRILEFLEFVKVHRDEIVNLKLKSGIFTFQTAITALDRCIAYTSSNVSQTKSVWEAMIRNQLADKTRDLILIGTFLFMLCLGVAAIIAVGMG